MKMEHTLAAPGDLTVKDVPFRAGDQVGEGAVVVSFE
jgi:3-methylcrotonyl-CoA carboxylase alpha subunit